MREHQIAFPSADRHRACAGAKSFAVFRNFIAGAVEENDYRAKLAAAGFANIETRVYRVEDAREFLSGQGLDVDVLRRR